MQFFNAEKADLSCIQQRTADRVWDYTVMIGNWMSKRYTNFYQSSMQDTGTYIQDFVFPSITTDLGQRFLLICTKSLDWNPQPSAVGWWYMKMSAKRAELKTYLRKRFKVSATVDKTRWSAPVWSGVHLRWELNEGEKFAKGLSP